jgi:hypothetical protein
MIQKKDTPAHTYTVELRLSGDQLDPYVISTQLNLLASNTFSKHQNLSALKQRQPYWAYNGKGATGFQFEWDSLETGLSFLLSTLAPKKTELMTAFSQFNGVWRCGHFQSSFDGGPVLSSGLLVEIGSYGIPLSIDNYFSDE